MSSDKTTGLLVRRARERFHTQMDWLDSWHSFSFASHVDPAWMGFGPLRVINDDTIAPGRGFGNHPHRDMEIITVMVEGQINHHDSMGHEAVLRAGDVQRMSAGTGVVHREMNLGQTPCRLLQIWIEPSHTGLPPSYEQAACPLNQGWMSLLNPAKFAGAMGINSSAEVWRAKFLPGQTWSLPCALGQSFWMQVISGGGDLALQEGPQGGDWLTLHPGDGVGAAASSVGTSGFTPGAGGADLLLVAFPAAA